MSAWNLYLIMMLDNVVFVFWKSFIIVGFLFILSIVGLLFTSFEESLEIYRIKWLRLLKCSFILMVFITPVASMTPSTKQMAAIYLIPKMVNNEQIQDIGKNSLNILEEHTKKYLNELMPITNIEENK